MKTSVIKIFCLLIAAYFLASFPLQAQGIAPFSETEKQEVLDFHNSVRAEAKKAPLECSSELAAFAQEWANYLADKGCNLQHRPRDGSKWPQKYGENIFWDSGRTYTLSDASKAWYSEKKFWKGGALSPKNWSKSGHYTQMIWGNCTKVGMGKAVCKNGATIIVANYDPAGNMMGEKP